MSSFWDLTERAQKLAMTLSTCGTQADPRHETATAIDAALTAQPDRPAAEVIAEVLRAKGPLRRPGQRARAAAAHPHRRGRLRRRPDPLT